MGGRWGGNKTSKTTESKTRYDGGAALHALAGLGDPCSFHNQTQDEAMAPLMIILSGCFPCPFSFPLW